MGTILVGIDGSDASRHAAREAARIARGLTANLELVAVSRPILFAAPASPELIDRLEAEELRACEQTLQQVEADPTVDLQGLAVRRRVLEGDPGEVLATLAEEPEVSLVVVGSRGRSAAARLLLGSVCDRVVHTSKKPVMVVR